jgi:1,4-dihydroxy-2-naphthoate polyprenyltransferase
MIKNLILASRANTVVATLSPIIIASLYAIASYPGFSYLIFSVCLLFGICIQLGTNLSNDYYDFVNKVDTIEKIGPKNSILIGMFSKDQFKKSFQLFYILAFVFGIILSLLQMSFLIFFGVCTSLLVSLFYTAGKKPLGYMALGEILVFFILGPFATFGIFYTQTKILSLSAALLGFGPGAISTAILIVNNLRDIESDRAANKKTIAILFGKNFSRFLYFLCVITACIVPMFFISLSHIYFLIIFSSLVCLLFLPLVKTVFTYKDPTVLDKTLENTAKILIIYTILLSIGLVLK